MRRCWLRAGCAVSLRLLVLLCASPAVAQMLDADAYAQTDADGGVPESGLRDVPWAPPLPADGDEDIDTFEAVAFQPIVDAPRPRAPVVTREEVIDGRMRSPEPVYVVDLLAHSMQAVDLGEVLARTPGLSVQRAGGLGSPARLSLDGLGGEQLRIAIDGLPLRFAGMALHVANLSVDLFDRAELYRGVAPIGLGLAALGGVLDLRTHQAPLTGVQASYQYGSFGTHRVTLQGRYRHEPSGFFAGAWGLLDRTRNDYVIDVEVPDDMGRSSTARVRRFHDAYAANGLRLEAGFVDRPWAKRLVLQGFVSNYGKDLQHDTAALLPLGEVEYGAAAYGASLRYEALLSSRVTLELSASYVHNRRHFSDESEWVYAWSGARVARSSAGELSAVPTDTRWWDHGVFGRALLQAQLAPGHVLRLAVTPELDAGSGRQRLVPTALGPTVARTRLFTLVSGVEYALDAFSGRFSNLSFVKHYYFAGPSSSAAAHGGELGDAKHHTFGWGDALRFALTPWLAAKASYEYSARLPNTDELFVGPRTAAPEFVRRPERSHNLNLGSRLELRRTLLGDLTVDVNVFARAARALRDVAVDGAPGGDEARGWGVDSALTWTVARGVLNVGGMFSWLDWRVLRASSMLDRRARHRPYVWASWHAEALIPSMPALVPYYVGRYASGRARPWDPPGPSDALPSQLTHSAGITWHIGGVPSRIVVVFEVKNLTDAAVSDVYGVQRPGRAFQLKFVGRL